LSAPTRGGGEGGAIGTAVALGVVVHVGRRLAAGRAQPMRALTGATVMSFEPTLSASHFLDPTSELAGSPGRRHPTIDPRANVPEVPIGGMARRTKTRRATSDRSSPAVRYRPIPVSRGGQTSRRRPWPGLGQEAGRRLGASKIGGVPFTSLGGRCVHRLGDKCEAVPRQRVPGRLSLPNAGTGRRPKTRASQGA
jgi:hypothetical protein